MNDVKSLSILSPMYRSIRDDKNMTKNWAKALTNLRQLIGLSLIMSL